MKSGDSCSRFTLRVWTDDRMIGPYWMTSVEGPPGDINCDAIEMLGTGIRDIHGAPIFEGDILAQENRKAFVEVIWDDDGSTFLIPGCWGSIRTCVERYRLEVVGNIHQNPELIHEIGQENLG
jgi:hypothetical protein